MIKINKLRLRNLDNNHLNEAGGHIGRNVVEITIKMKTIVRKPLMIKIIKLRLRNLDNYNYFSSNNELKIVVSLNFLNSTFKNYVNELIFIFQN